MSQLLVLVIIVLLAVGAIALLVKRMLFICQPNEVLIFSGTHRQVGKRTVGYKVVKGGRKMKVPLIEVVDRLDLTNMAINVAVKSAFSHGGIPLNIEGVANVKIPGEEPILGNAIERFLGKDRAEIMAIAKETLEGNLRGVLAKLTPEQVNDDKLAFAKQLMEEADQDLNRLGLVLDTLKIQNVSDDVGYLDCIGRIKGAEIRRDAVIAEAESQAESAVRDASNVERREVVQIEAALRTLEAETNRRVADAETQKAALEAEARGTVAALVAQAKAELAVQRARIEKVRNELEADIIEPARAEMERKNNEARAGAARIVEEGRATAAVLEQITAAWQMAGPNARDIFLLQKLDALVETLAKTVSAVKIDKVTVLGVSGAGGDLAQKAIAASEQLKAALGVDLLGALERRVTPAPSTPAPTSPKPVPRRDPPQPPRA